MVTKLYTFPLGTQIDNVDVSFSEPYTIQVAQEIMPAQKAHYINADLNNQVVTNLNQNKEIYENDAWYPETPYSYDLGAGLYEGSHVLFSQSTSIQ